MKLSNIGLAATAPRALWFTGLSAAGKSTISRQLELVLQAQGVRVVVLDADLVRASVSSDLGYTAQDRTENVRRIAAMARLLVDEGLTVLVSAASPSAADRRMAAAHFQPGDFRLIHVDAPICVLQQRDPKGLYAAYARGEIRNMLGLDLSYETPANPDHYIRSDQNTVEQICADLIGRFFGETAEHAMQRSPTAKRTSAA